MNLALFDAVFKQDMKSRSLKDKDAVANAISNAYDNANRTGSLTVFGSKFLSSDKESLKKSIVKSLEQNYSTKKKSSELEQGWVSMAEGFVQYWKDANFSILPAPLPAMTPNKGVSVKYAGNIKDLAKELKVALSSGDTDECSYILSNLLANHQKNIGGTYSGFLNNVPTEFPWVGVVSTTLNAPVEKKTETGLRKVKPVGGLGSKIKEVRDFENRRMFEYVEWGQLFSADGKYVSREFTSNSPVRVSWPLDLTIRQFLNGDYISIHNHPPDPTPKPNTDNAFHNVHTAPSPGDFVSMFVFRQYEMRVMDLAYIYIIQEPPDGHDFYAPWNTSNLRNEITEIYTTSYKNMYEKISNDNTFFEKIYQQFIGDLTSEALEFIFDRGGTHSNYIKAKSVICHAESTNAGAKEIAKKYNLAYERISRKQLYGLK